MLTLLKNCKYLNDQNPDPKKPHLVVDYDACKLERLRKAQEKVELHAHAIKTLYRKTGIVSTTDVRRLGNYVARVVTQ